MSEDCIDLVKDLKAQETTNFANNLVVSTDKISSAMRVEENSVARDARGKQEMESC